MRRLYPLVAAALALIATGALAWSIHRNEQAATARMLREAAERIEERIGAHILLLHSVKGLFIGLGGEVSREQFRGFLEAMPIERTMPGIQGIGFARAVPSATPLEATMKLARDYGIRREPWPATSQDIRFPIVLLEPSDARNRAAMGFDMFSEAHRREAMLEAWRTGRPAATRPVQLVQEIDADKQVGFLIYLPLYRSELVPAGGAPPPDMITGFVYAPFRAGDLFATVLGEAPAPRVRIQAYSGEVSKETLLFANAARIDDAAVHTIDVAGRTWILRLGERTDGLPSRPVLFVMVLGLMLAAAAAFLVRAQTRALDAAEALAGETRARIAEKDILLQEMNHRLKNLFARTLSIFRLSAREAPDLETLVATFGERLQAMAKVQDSVAGSQWRRIALGALLDQEVRHMAGGDGRLVLDGPLVELDESQSQAMGLVAHELATNSLKYGALAGGGTLAVTWRRERRANGHEVVLDWSEQGLAERPDFSGAGFGSRLVGLLVEGTLRGALERELHEDGLRYRLRFPVGAA